MNHFTNIKENNENISFELNNNNIIKTSLANAIRRILISEIPIFSIDHDTIIFEENSSMLHNSFLSKRLKFFPLNYDSLKELNIEQLTIYLDITNNTDHIISVTSKDFIIKLENTIIDNILISDKILFAKLKPTQRISLSAKFDKSNSKLKGSSYSPVCKSIMTYKIDDRLVNELIKKFDNEEQKEYFLKTQTEPYYLKNEYGEPKVYILDIESNNMIKPIQLVSLTLNILKEKLQLLHRSLNENIYDKIKIIQSNKLFIAFDFIIIDEDHTLGNLITSYLKDHPNCDFSGYIIPHPNDNKLLITTSAKMNNTLENNKKVFMEVINNIVKLVNELINNWNTANSAKTITKKIKIKK